MLEIPESLTIASQLNAAVRGKRIAGAEAEYTKHGFAWYEGDPGEYGEKMTGQIFGDARGIGSMVEIKVGAYRFVAGDGTNIRYFPPDVRLPDRYQTRITFEDGSSLICTVQMYGSMTLFLPEEYDNAYYQAGRVKPMPGTPEFDYAYFQSLQEGLPPNLSMKAFLATRQRIPGLGNGVLQDILLKAGLHPKQKIGRLRESDWRRTYDAVVSIIGKMTECGGRDTEKDLFGMPGNYLTKLSKKTVGKPCPYCGNVIQKATYLGGTVYFCPQCQSMQ